MDIKPLSARCRPLPHPEEIALHHDRHRPRPGAALQPRLARTAGAVTSELRLLLSLSFGNCAGSLSVDLVNIQERKFRPGPNNSLECLGEVAHL